MYHCEHTRHLRDRAENCLTIAEFIEDKHRREAYLRIAERYFVLADNEEAIAQAKAIKQIGLHPPL